jgi:hypothetical protein
MAAETSSAAQNNILQFHAARSRRSESGTGEGFDVKPRRGGATGEELDELKQRVGNLESTVEEIQGRTHGEKALPENIYQIFDESNQEQISENLVLKIRELLNNGLQHLKQAHFGFNEEIERESEVDLFFSNVRRVAVFPSKNSNFEDAITALLVALQSNVANGYSREKILALKDVTELLLDNIFMSEEILDNCITILEKAKFDLSYPFKGIDFDELL